MKSLLIAALVALSSYAFGQFPLQISQLQNIVISPGENKFTNNILVPYTRGAVAPNNTTALFFDVNNVLRVQDAITLATQKVLLDGTSGQTLVAPIIKNGLTASGSVSNDFSGSTGSFKPSTGGFYNTNTSYTASGGATVVLTAAQSGGTFLFDSASGVAYTLPAPVKGLNYNFICTVSATSNAHEVQTSSSSVFLEGAIIMVTTGATSGFTIGAVANGSTHQAVKMNGTTSGGALGTHFTITCQSGTEWSIVGTALGTTGQQVTPFTATP